MTTIVSVSTGLSSVRIHLPPDEDLGLRRLAFTVSVEEAKELSRALNAALHVPSPASALRLYDVQAYVAKTLSNIEDDDSVWTASDVREFIDDILMYAGPVEGVS